MPKLKMHPEIYLDGCESGRYAPLVQPKEFQAKQKEGYEEEHLCPDCDNEKEGEGGKVINFKN
jgi:hypothetical protein